MGKNNHERAEWGSVIEYYLCALGFSVGFGSLWRFPYLVFENGGGAFLIPYIIFVILISYPMYYMETAMGQLFKTSSTGCYDQLAKRFKGIGYSQMVTTFFLGSYYNILLAYSLLFLWDSFSWPLPWKVEDPERTGQLWNPDYFYKDVLNITDSIADLGGMNYPVLICSILSFFICYLCISRGINGTGKVVYITSPAPYVFLFAFLFRGMFLDGAWDGISFLFRVDWSKLYVLDTWYRAANQVLFQYSIATGTVFALASYKEKKEKLVKPAVIILIITGLTGILCGLTVFTYMGNMAKVAGVDISELPLAGPELVFVAYPAALTLMPGSTIWAVCFFVMLFFLGIDTEFAFMETLSGFIEDEKISFFGKKYSIFIMRIIIVIGLFIAGFPLNFDGGFYFLALYDDYATIVPLMLYALLECYVIGWIFGTDKLDKLINENTGERFPNYASFCIKYVILAILAVLTLASFIKLVFVDLFKLPWWAAFIALALLVTPVVIIIYNYIKHKDDIQNTLEQRKTWIELGEPLKLAITSE